MDPLVEFLDACAAELATRAEQATWRRDELTEGARVFAADLAQSTAIDCEITTVPVTSCLADLAPGPLIDLFQTANDGIKWVPTSRTDDGGTETALALLNEVREFNNVICGLVLIGPNHRYPLHSHPPQELYLPLTAGGRWRFGGSETHRELADGELVYNHPDDLHEVLASGSPLLALYVLW